jgi:ABC-type branched-subunit amino acid transport system ATPase component
VTPTLTAERYLRMTARHKLSPDDMESFLAFAGIEQFALLALDACDHAYVLRKGQLTYDRPGNILRQDADRLGQAHFGRADESATAAIG